MRAFSDTHPAVLLLYFSAVAGVCMFVLHPLIQALALFGAVLACLFQADLFDVRTHLGFLLLFMVTALLNPLFHHNGVTVLFVLNNNPITLEAVLYGLTAAAMLLAVLYWFRLFTSVMTSDKLLFLFGALSPKAALLLSMTLRYIPLFRIQAHKVEAAQRALGLYKEDNIVDTLRGRMRVLSVMVTWTLENGIVTADSMTARGYGVGRRSYFSVYRFCSSDAVLLAVITFLTAVTVLGAGTGALQYAFYPEITAPPASALQLYSLIAYGILTLLPVILRITEEIKWKSLLSKV